jgi:hypothetical protein
MAGKENAMIELTDEQRRELEQPGPVQVRDPQTNETYVLVRADVYARMRAVIDGTTRRAGWDDPALDVYEKYRPTVQEDDMPDVAPLINEVMAEDDAGDPLLESYKHYRRGTHEAG